MVTCILHELLTQMSTRLSEKSRLIALSKHCQLHAWIPILACGCSRTQPKLYDYSLHTMLVTTKSIHNEDKM